MTITAPVIGDSIPSGGLMQDTAYSAETDSVGNLFDNTSGTTASLNGNTCLLYTSDGALGVFKVAVATDDDKVKVLPELFGPGDHFQAVASGHPDVGDQQVRLVLPHHFQAVSYTHLDVYKRQEDI